MVFGDSACYGMLACLAQTFGRMVFVHSPTLDYDLIAEERPDVVITEMTERFLIMTPDDSKAKPIRAGREARSKRREDSGRESSTGIRLAEMPAEHPRALDRNDRDGARPPARPQAPGRRHFHLGDGVRRADAREALNLAWEDVERRRDRSRTAWTDATTSRPGELRPPRVPLLGPLADDLAAWRRPARIRTGGYVFHDCCESATGTAGFAVTIAPQSGRPGRIFSVRQPCWTAMPPS